MKPFFQGLLKIPVISTVWKYRFSIMVGVVLLSILGFSLADYIGYCKADKGGKPTDVKTGKVPVTNFDDIDKYLQCLEKEIPEEYLKKCDN